MPAFDTPENPGSLYGLRRGKGPPRRTAAGQTGMYSIVLYTKYKGPILLNGHGYKTKLFPTKPAVILKK